MEGSVPADGEGQIQWLPKVFMGKNIFGQDIFSSDSEISDAASRAVDGENVKGSVRSGNGALSAAGKIVENPEGPVSGRKGRRKRKEKEKRKKK
ncbi:hypothetical protein MASR2M17_23820 [Aminivibrio sp.]